MKNQRPPKTKDKLHLHLEWLLARGEDKPVTHLCPVCRERPIEYLSLRGNDRDGYSMGLSFACCRDEKCKRTMITDKIPTFVRPRLSVVTSFVYRTDQRRFIEVYRQLHGIDKNPLTADRAFEFFSKHSQ